MAPAATCTDAVVGAKPDFSTVISIVPGTVMMVVVPSRIGPVGCASHDDFCVLDRLFGGTDLNTNRRRLILGSDRGRRKADKNSDRQHEQAHTHLRGCVRTHQSIRLLNRLSDSGSLMSAEGGRVGRLARRGDE